jgi:putative transposase
MPSASSVAELFKRTGLVTPRRRRQRVAPPSHPIATSESPNQLWSADFKGWFRTRDGYRCDPLM